MNTSDFDKIIASEHLMLIDFYATWCGACRAIDPILDRIALSMSDIVTLVRIDTTTASSTELVRRYNIVAVPTLMLFFRGDVVWRNCGVLSFERLSATLRRFQTVGAY